MIRQHTDRACAIREAVICCAISFLLTATAIAQTSSSEEVQASARHFVQSFYDWYAPLALSQSKEPTWIVAINKRSSLFDLPLRQALEHDFAAQAKSHEQIVGLDFDPFVSSQDPDKKYETGKISEQGARVLVDVYALQHGTTDKAAVIAEIQERNGSWVFVNFLYPNNGDLLSILRRLRKDREIPAK